MIVRDSTQKAETILVIIPVLRRLRQENQKSQASL
jgi:hypothetical protein